MIPYLRIENLKHHSLSHSTYLYSPYMGVPPPPPRSIKGGAGKGVVPTPPLRENPFHLLEVLLTLEQMTWQELSLAFIE